MGKGSFTCSIKEGSWQRTLAGSEDPGSQHSPAMWFWEHLSPLCSLVSTAGEQGGGIRQRVSPSPSHRLGEERGISALPDRDRRLGHSAAFVRI